MYIISNETASFIEVKINMHSNFKENILYWCLSLVSNYTPISPLTKQ